MPKASYNLTLGDLARINAESIARAGPRYTPSLDPNAPNLRIAQLTEALDALSYSAAFKSRVSVLENKLRGAWAKCADHLRTRLAAQAKASHLGADLLATLMASEPGTGSRIERELTQAQNECLGAVHTLESEFYDELEKLPKESKERERVQWSIDALRDLREPLGELRDFLQSPAFALIYKNSLFIRGEWGSGKTHLVCDFARTRTDQGLPALLFLAQALPGGQSPLKGAAELVGGELAARRLIAELNELGRASGTRALLIFDGINEGDRRSWRKLIEPLVALVAKHQNVGLVLTCRTPFDERVLTKDAAGGLVMVRHFGFEDIEFDAQSEFFRYYGIPTPHIPLLAAEFSRPLFLKMLCASISTLSKSAKSKHIKSFASGHKGMTKLLEDFVVAVGDSIEKAHGLGPKMCWYLLKGRGDGPAAVGLAPLMAERGQDFLDEAECLKLIGTVCSFNKRQAHALLRAMVAEGLLAEEVFYERDGWKPVIRLPYQRLSDHLISRHLLARYLDNSSAKAIRQCFRPSQPLGRIFKLDRWGRSFAAPGLATAVMLEFPERVKRAVHPDKQELAFYLPPKARTEMLSDPFIEGLLWRSADSFTTQTDHLVGFFLQSTNRPVVEETLEALVALASRTGHPYSAQKLYRYLGRLPLPERDLFWTDFLRTRGPSSSTYRVLDWVLSPMCASMDEGTAENLIWLISLFLTSTVRPLRDRATRCLVVLGDRFPRLLFTHAHHAFEFNDPYVAERMLAASFGALMRRWATAAPDAIVAAVELATDLRRRLVGSKTSAPIEHVLMRDFASGFVELAARIAPAHRKRLSLQGARISKKSNIPPATRIKDADVQAAKSAIRMDFNNYTVGRLVKGRRNYDDNHPGYQAVRRQIRWRILDLGYDEARFQALDRQIGSMSYHRGRGDDAQKVERYGKKYAWIAFYEVAGRLQIKGELPDRSDPRIADIDIDPSFPDPPKEWAPPLPNLFGRSFAQPHEWLAGGSIPNYAPLLVREEVDAVPGPWVLLEGYIMATSPTDERQTFTFLRGLIVPQANVGRLEELVRTKEYPGNMALPEPGTDHYLFAGEIGWSDKFGPYLHRNGRAVPQMEEAFSSVEMVTEFKPYGKLTSTELWQHHSPFIHIVSDDEEPQPEPPEPSADTLVELKRAVHVPGVRVEVPVRTFGWESYHSQENDGRNPDYPAPSLVDALGLRKVGAGVDMIDERGRLATIYRSRREEERGRTSHLLYLRRDLLDLYLKKRRATVVWVNWGEREFDYTVAEKIREDRDSRAVWDTHAHIHKRMYLYDRGSNDAVGEIMVGARSADAQACA